MTGQAKRPDASGVDADLLQSVLVADSHYQPIDLHPRASVAAIFRAGATDTELLFIQRATRHGDPWSGHMAFPGGRDEEADRSPFETAERETREEIGLDLTAAQRLGSLADLDGGRASNRLIAVSSHCYWLAGERPVLDPNEEVADVIWVPLHDLLDGQRHIEYWYPPSGSAFPGIQLDIEAQVIWGLTLRFLADLFDRLDRGFITLS